MQSTPSSSSNPPSLRQTFSKLSSTGNLCWKYGIFPTFLALFILSTVLIVRLFFSNSFGSESIQELPNILPSDATKYHEDHIFPHIVHQMWKTKDSLTTDFKRWKKGCERLNSNYTFHLYDDNDLKLFTHQHYPEYTELFDALKGVYMADMARMLIAYHFGGLYIDLDFYCHRPFECLENYILHQLIEHISPAHNSTQAERSATKKRLLDDKAALMIVSREPELHAHYIHKQDRIVIQDFFLVTPKHPFFKWFLDRENRIFLENRDTKKAEMKKGPFSYSIQTTLDDYYRSHRHQIYTQIGSLVATRALDPCVAKATATDASLRSSSGGSDSGDSGDSGSGTQRRRSNKHRSRRRTRRALQANSNTTSTTVTTPETERSVETPSTRSQSNSVRGAQKSETVHEFILEMRADVVHPLVDSTNSHIPKGCEDKENNERFGLTNTCNAFSRGRYLFPSVNTMLVHMWTHSFLSFSFLRGWYEHSNYMHVENTLQPTYQCPIPSVWRRVIDRSRDRNRNKRAIQQRDRCL